MVKLAVDIVADGSIPGPGAHGRRSEFLRRCADAVKITAPGEETIITRLSTEDQAVVKRALGGDEEPYDGCMNEECLDEQTTWVVHDLTPDVSRCTRCKMPKAFGRNYTNLADLMPPVVVRRYEALGTQAFKRARIV